MQIELNRNELKELIDKISFLITDVDKRTDKRKESERSNKNNHFGILSMGRYPRSEYPSSFFISFISKKYKKIEEELKNFKESDVHNNFCNLRANELIIGTHKFIKLSKNDYFGQSSYINNFNLDEMNSILTYSTCSELFNNALLRIFIENNLIDEYINKKTLNSANSQVSRDFNEYFKNYNDKTVELDSDEDDPNDDDGKFIINMQVGGFGISD